MKRSRLFGLTLCGLTAMMVGVGWLASQERAEAHCQVPCGIYDDAGRIDRLREDATTIAKAIAQINELAGGHGAQAVNQATRWVITKEAHASHVIEVVSEYFLTQKVKPVASGADGHQAYLSKLADHHAVMVAAMKAKQRSDPGAADALFHAIDQLATHYK